MQAMLVRAEREEVPAVRLEVAGGGAFHAFQQLAGVFRAGGASRSSRGGAYAGEIMHAGENLLRQLMAGMVTPMVWA